MGHIYLPDSIGSAACSVMIFLEAAAFPSPAFLFFCPRGMMNFNYRLLSKIYQRLYHNDPFSSVVTSGMPLNQLYTPAEPKPECPECRFTNAHVTAKPTLATAKPTLKQRRLQRCTAKATPVCSIFPHFVRGDERCRNSAPSPYRSRNAPTKFGRCM